VTDKYKLEWRAPDRDKIIKLLAEQHGFSDMRIDHGVKRLQEAFDKNVSQSSLRQWF